MTEVTLAPNADDAHSSNAATTSGLVWYSLVADASDLSGWLGDLTDSWWWATVHVASMPKASAVSKVRVYARYRPAGSITPGETDYVKAAVRIGGTNYYGSPVAVAAGQQEYYWDFVVNPAAVLQWTAAGIDGSGFGIYGYSDIGVQTPEVQKIWVVVTYDPIPVDQAASRDAVSRRMFLRAAPKRLLTLRGGLELLDLAHHQAVDLHHIHALSETGAGWSTRAWERGMLAVVAQSVDPMTDKVTLTLRDERALRCLLYESGWAREGGVAQNGLMMFSNGATRTFTRSSAATFTDASGASVTVQADVEAFTADGQEFEVASGGRAADVLVWTNNSGARVWCAAQGRFRCEYAPKLSAAALTSYNPTLAYCYHDSNNYAWVYYDGANARFVFEVKAGGTVARAVKAVSIVAGTLYDVDCRWVGSRGEHGLDPYTLTIAVNGVAGTDAVAAAAMSEQATSTLHIGSKAGSDQARGYIRRRISRQHPPTNIEMQRSFS